MEMTHSNDASDTKGNKEDNKKAKGNKRKMVELTKMDLSPDLVEIQKDWTDLLQKDELDVQLPPPSTLSNVDKEALAALWFDDGTLGVSIDYPQTNWELKCYQMSRSRFNTVFFTLVTFVHLMLPFLEPPICPWEMAIHGENVDYDYTDSGHYISLQGSRIISLFCVLTYCIDIYMRIVINSKGMFGTSTVGTLSGQQIKPGYKDMWVLFRLICCIAMLIETFAFFISGTPLRFTRSLVPLMYISRRHSLRKMAHGLLLAFSKTVNILMLQIVLLICGTYVGFVLFHGISVNTGQRFDSVGESILTVLLSITSRSYNIFTLEPYFMISEWSSAYFISLTLLGDLVCINLIIAVGNRQYRIFGINTFRRQIANRRQAFIAIHELLSDDNGFIARDTWKGFCRNIQGKYSVRQDLSDALFSLESKQFNELLIETRAPTAEDVDVIDCEGLFRLCALLSTRVDFNLDVEEEEEEDEAVSTPLRDAATLASDDPIPGAPQRARANTKGKIARRGSEITFAGFVLPGRPILDDVDEEDDDEDEESVLPLEAMPIRKSSIRRSIESQERLKKDEFSAMDRKKKKQSLLRKFYVFFIRHGRDIMKYEVPVIHLLPSCCVRDNETNWFYRWWLVILNFQVAPFDIFSKGIRYLLAIQIVGFAASDSNVWTEMGWVVEAFLWVEMVMLIVCYGLGPYIKRSGYGLILWINILTLILMIDMGEDPERHAGFRYYALVILQMSRFSRLIRFVHGFSTFNAIAPLMFRVTFIIFAVIYFFAGFAHNRMCGILNADKIVDVDDDSDMWLRYQDIMNFNTYLQSIFTLYQTAILGNWSPIMGVAAQTDPVLSLMFFYTYRLTMTLAILPLLFAVIIQAFINRKDREEKMRTADTAPLSPPCETKNNPRGIVRVTILLAFLFYFRLRFLGQFKFQRSLSSSDHRVPSVSDAIGASRQDVNLGRRTVDEYSSSISIRPTFREEPAAVTDRDTGGNAPHVYADAEPPGPSTPASGGPASAKRRVSVKHGKGESMMSFWAQGEKATTDAQRDKKKADDLQRQLDLALDMLKQEQVAAEMAEKKYQALLQRMPIVLEVPSQESDSAGPSALSNLQSSRNVVEDAGTSGFI